MSDTSNTVIDRLKCFFAGHDRVPDRAVERESGTWERIPNDPDEEPRPIDGCTVVEKCVRCGSEQRVAASVDTAKSMGVSLEWDRAVDTDTDQ